jgi:hypothetical protein
MSSFKRDKLSAISLPKQAKSPGVLYDGGGLMLRTRAVDGGVTSSWIFRFFMGKAQVMGLGKYPDVSLADARALAAPLRTLKAKGINPATARAEAASAAALASARTFRAVTADYFTSKAPGMSPGALKEWKASLDNHALPVLGDVPVDTIDAAAVVAMLRPNGVQR